MPQRTRRGLTAAVLLFLAAACAAEESPAVFVASLGIPRGGGLDGLSGLELSPDGESFVAVSDRGWFVTGEIGRKNGMPVSVRPGLPAIRMLDDKGRPVAGNREDAEGLAIAPDGQIFVSYEIYHRVRRFSDIRKPAIWLPDLPDRKRLGRNTGFEALAIGPDNALYALPEALTDAAGIPVYRFALPDPVAMRDGRPVYRYRGISWTQPLHLPRRGKMFRPVGADFGPDGRFYLLERAFLPPFGFRSRVRRFDFGPSGFTNETVLLETFVGRHGNLEGLSVWRDDGGAIRLTMISDDNGFAIQRNQIVEYLVASAPGEG